MQQCRHSESLGKCVQFGHAASEVRNTPNYALMDGQNIPVNVELANAIGLNEAILLQQIHYWCCKAGENGENRKDNHYWVYNSVDKWTEQLPWKSPTTTKKTIKSLADNGLILTDTFSYGNRNRTKWYRIDYDKLVGITASFTPSKLTGYRPDTPSKMSIGSDRICPNDKTESDRTINIDLTKNTRVNSDSPLTVNPTTVESLSAEKDNCLDPEERKLSDFIDWYCDEYVTAFGRNHPRLNASRQAEVIAALSVFLNDPAYGLDIDVGIEYLQDMAHNFFDRVKSNDHHIFHFANPEILKYCFLNVGY